MMVKSRVGSLAILGKTSLILVSLLGGISACNQRAETGSSSSAPGTANAPAAVTPAPVPSSNPSPPPSPTPAQPDLISTAGIGVARLGTTFGELKQQLGEGTEFQVKSPFIADFDAIAVLQAGEVQYYILYLTGQTFTDADVIQGLLTDNPKFKTAAGVGAGTSIRQAEQAYGNAILSYNLDNEAREYVRFERQSSSNLSFATGNANTQTAGIYSSPKGPYNETETFREDARIQSVLVVCLSEDCATP